MRRYSSLLFVSLFLILTACASETAVVSELIPTAGATVVATATEITPTTALAAEEEAPAPNTPTSFPTATTEAGSASAEIVEATATSEPTVTAVVAAAVPSPTTHPFGVVPGRTEEGAYFLGNPDAPITLIDYSDFL